jgi:hypothetical protein
MALMNEEPMVFQTRNEAGGTVQHQKFMDAIQAYERDPTIWKISFDYNGINYRWRPKTKSDIWENEDCIMNLSEQYARELNRHRLFWVFQVSIPYNHEDLIRMHINGVITREERERLWDRACIREVITNEEFINRYRNI